MKIVAIERINGRLMVEIDEPSSDGACRLLTLEEMQDIDQRLQQRLSLIDACRALVAIEPPYGQALAVAYSRINEALAEIS